jgi:hypothetical protein
MKIIFNILLILIALIAFVPAFRRFLFWLLVGRQLVKEQKKANQTTKRREGEVRVDTSKANDKPRFDGGEYVDYEDIK